jgi:hypothetical protein
MTSKGAAVTNVDELLIAIFLTAAIVFIVLWSVAMLKWRKRYLYRIMPCLER